MSPKYPHVSVQMVGQDGNAFAILGRCQREARKGHLSQEEIALFLEEAMAGDYDNLLQVVLRWFNVA